MSEAPLALLSMLKSGCAFDTTNEVSLFHAFLPFPLPVLLGRSAPTLAPGCAFLGAIMGPFFAELLEPPNGCATAFIDRALVFGKSFPLAPLFFAMLPALSIGFSG